jgi:hypothetical protein
MDNYYHNLAIYTKQQNTDTFYISRDYHHSAARYVE